MVVPKKVYVHAEKTRSRSQSANRRRRSFQFPFRSSAAADDSSISTNSFMDDEDDLQPVFQDVADALYKNTSPFMETTLIDFSKRAKDDDDDDAGDGDGDNESEGRWRKARKITVGRQSVKPKSKPELVRSLRQREERPVGRRNIGANAWSNGQWTKMKEQPLVDKTLEKTHAPFIPTTSKLSFESDEPIATERREPSVSVRTEELVNGKHPIARQPSFPNSNANQNRQQPTKRDSLPHNKPRRPKEVNAKEKVNAVKVQLPTNRFAYDIMGLPLSEAYHGGNAEMHRSTSANSKGANGETAELSTPVRASGFPKSRTRSLRGRSPVNLEAIPAFSKSQSQGSRGRLLGLRRSLSKNRSQSKERQRAASASNSSPSLPSSQQQVSFSNISETVDLPIKLLPSKAQESQAPVDVVTLDSVLAQVIRQPSELFAGLAKDLESLWSCSTKWFEEPDRVEAAAVDGRNDASTHNETVGSSEQTSEKREKSEEDKGLKSHETSAFQAPENQTQSCSSTVTPLDAFRAYMNFMISSSKQLALSPSRNPPSTVPSVSAREFPPPIDVAPATCSVPTAPSIPSATTDGHGLPPLCPQKPTKRTRTGNLQMLRIRFRRDSSYSTRSGTSGGSSDFTPSLVIIK